MKSLKFALAFIVTTAIFVQAASANPCLQHILSLNGQRSTTSLERQGVIGRLSRILMKNESKQDSHYSNIRLERMYIASFLISDLIVAPLFYELLKMYPASRSNAESKKAYKENLATLQSMVLHRLNFEFTPREALMNLMNPANAWGEMQTVYAELKNLHSNSETQFAVWDGVSPKEFLPFNAAPEDVQKQADAFYFTVTGEAGRIPVIPLGQNRFAVVAHVWNYRFAQNQNNPFELIKNMNGHEEPVAYTILKRGKAVEDVNGRATQEALNDLVIIKINDNVGEHARFTSGKMGAELHLLATPQTHTFFQFPHNTHPLFYSHGKILGKEEGLYVVDMLSHTGTSGYAVYDSAGSIVGIVWGNHSLRRFNDLSPTLQRNYREGLLLVENEVSYVIPIEAVFDFANRPDSNPD